MMIKTLPDRIEYRNENGQLHRLDGPAIVFKNEYKFFYYINGIPVKSREIDKYQKSIFNMEEL